MRVCLAKPQKRVGKLATISNRSCLQMAIIYQSLLPDIDECYDVKFIPYKLGLEKNTLAYTLLSVNEDIKWYEVQRFNFRSKSFTNKT